MARITLVQLLDHAAEHGYGVRGFTSVMMDGSLKADAKTATDYDYKVDITRRVVESTHWIGASVEGELGVLGSLEQGGGEQEDGHGVEGKVSHDPCKFLKPAMDAMRDLCGERFEQFGTAGHAGRIRVIPLAEMAKRYRSGALVRGSAWPMPPNDQMFPINVRARTTRRPA